MLQIIKIIKSQNKYNVIQKATKAVMAFQNLFETTGGFWWVSMALCNTYRYFQFCYRTISSCVRDEEGSACPWHAESETHIDNIYCADWVGLKAFCHQEGWSFVLV